MLTFFSSVLKSHTGLAMFCRFIPGNQYKCISLGQLGIWVWAGRPTEPLFVAEQALVLSNEMFQWSDQQDVLGGKKSAFCSNATEYAVNIMYKKRLFCWCNYVSVIRIAFWFWSRGTGLKAIKQDVILRDEFIKKFRICPLNSSQTSVGLSLSHGWVTLGQNWEERKTKGLI